MFEYSGPALVGELGSSGNLFLWLLLIILLHWYVGVYIFGNFRSRCLRLGLSSFGRSFLPLLLFPLYFFSGLCCLSVACFIVCLACTLVEECLLLMEAGLLAGVVCG